MILKLNINDRAAKAIKAGDIIKFTSNIETNITFSEFNNYINSLDISFRKLQNSKEDYKKLYKWCKNKNVYEWFEQRILSYDEIVAKYKSKLEAKIQDLYVIKSNNMDIGLIQIYKFYNDINLEDVGKYRNTYEYDIFIGENEYLNKGIGKSIITKINDIIYTKYNADSIILRPFKDNKRAINCYQKCNFKKITEYIGNDTLGNEKSIVVLLNSLNSG